MCETKINAINARNSIDIFFLRNEGTNKTRERKLIDTRNWIIVLQLKENTFC